MFWLLQGEGDSGSYEVEGFPLFAGRLGEHRYGRWCAGEADLVTGEGGQVGEEAAEAAVGAAVFVALAGGLGLGVGGAGGRGDGVGAGGRVLVGEGQWCPGAAQVPGEVAGEHADQHVGFDAFFEPVPDGAQVQVVGLEVAEVPLDGLITNGKFCCVRRLRLSLTWWRRPLRLRASVLQTDVALSGEPDDPDPDVDRLPPAQPAP